MDQTMLSGLSARTLLEEVLIGEPLAPKEVQVLELAARGLTTKETAKKLNISTETARTYRKRIIAKLGARNMTHAAVTAIFREII